MPVNTARMQMRAPRGDVRADHTPLSPIACDSVRVCVHVYLKDGGWDAMLIGRMCAQYETRLKE